MDANKLVEALARAVKAAEPAQDYCLFWSDYWWWMCMTKAEWSGWMQAIGAAGAILWSGRLVNKQIRASRKAEADRFSRRMNAYAAFFERAHELATEAFTHCTSVAQAVGYTEFVHDRRIFDDLKSALAEPKLADMESGDGVFALIYMRRAMEDIETLVHRVSIMNEEREGPPHLDDDYVKERDRAKRHLDEAISRFKAARRQVDY